MKEKFRATWLRGWSSPHLPKGVAAWVSGLSWMIALFSLLVFVAGSIPEQKREIEDALRSKARGIAAALHDDMASVALSGDYTSLLDHTTQAIAGDDSIDFMVVTKNDGSGLIVERHSWRTAQLGADWSRPDRAANGVIEVAPLFGRRVFRFATPYSYSSISWGWIHVGLSLHSYDESVARLYHRTLLMAMVCVGGSLLASLIFAGRLVRPILRLQAVVGRLAAGDLAARASVRGTQEIEILAQSFNRMADSLQQRDAILESVRFAAQRFVSAADWHAAISDVMAKIGQAAQVSRVFLWKKRPGVRNGLTGNVLSEWVSAGAAAPCGASGVDLWTCGDWAAHAGALTHGELVLVEAEPRPGGAPEARSSVLVPIEVAGEFFGALGFDDFTRNRAWSDAERDSFRSAAGMLGAAITRQQAREYVDNILRSMGEALLVIDPELKVRQANPSALRLLGYTEQELIGQPAGLVIEGGVPVGSMATERTYVSRAGDRIQVLFSCAELRRGPDSLEGYVCLAQELTELKRAQAELVNARDAAEQANRAKSIFLANMSHELRTPLNAVIGYSQMLREDYIGPEQLNVRQDLEKIERSGQILLGIINDILDLSKIEAGRETVKAQVFDLAAVLEEVSNAMQPLVRQQGNVLEIHCPEDARKMYADLPKFRQSILNLVNNALKFTERGSVSVAVNRLRDAQGDWTEVHVSDTGIGIGRDDIQKLFQPFSQVDGSATRKYNGTGLGLAISKKFCQMMGGDITVESNLGYGSRFTMRLPARRADGRDSQEGSKNGA